MTTNDILTRIGFTPQTTVQPSSEEVRASQALTLQLSELLPPDIRLLVGEDPSSVELVGDRKVVEFRGKINVRFEIDPFGRRMVLQDLTGHVATQIVDFIDGRVSDPDLVRVKGFLALVLQRAPVSRFWGQPTSDTTTN